MTVVELLSFLDEGLASALDVDVAGLGKPEVRASRSGKGERRLSAFDLMHEGEERRYRWRRVLATAAVVLGSAAAVAGSVAIGL
jgi:hypothetical protein